MSFPRVKVFSLLCFTFAQETLCPSQSQPKNPVHPEAPAQPQSPEPTVGLKPPETEPVGAELSEPELEALVQLEHEQPETELEEPVLPEPVGPSLPQQVLGQPEPE